MALPSQHLHQKQVDRLDFGVFWEIEDEEDMGIWSRELTLFS